MDPYGGQAGDRRIEVARPRLASGGVMDGHRGSRPEDDVQLRQRLLLLGRLTAAAAVLVLAAGFVGLGLRDDPAPAGPVEAAPTTVKPVAAVKPSRTGSPTAPVAWQVARTGNVRGDAALAGYQDYLGTATRLVEEPDPADPALPLVAAEPELSRLRRALSVLSDAQQSQRGPVRAYARLSSLTPTRATVIGCADTAGQQLYTGIDRKVGWRGPVTVHAAFLQLQGTRWLVTRLSPLPAARCRS